MSDIADMALQEFDKGNNCAQIVLGVFAPDFGLDDEIARRISSSFGGGVGRMGGTCGAVSAAYMVLGLKYGDTDSQDPKAREKQVRLLQSYRKRFEDRRGSVSCRELLGFNLRDPLQYNKVVERGLFFELCPNLVADAIEILNEVINQEALNTET